MTPHYTILDGYNVLFGCEPVRHHLRLGHLAAAEYLLQWIVPLTVIPNSCIIVVFDGGSLSWKSECISHGKNPNLLVVNTLSNKSADAAILDIIEKLQRRSPHCSIEVVTDDGGLRTSVAETGSEWLSVAQFAKKAQDAIQRQDELLRRHRTKNKDTWSNRLADYL
jgi:predicted RNA-binding protein with PIN domain